MTVRFGVFICALVLAACTPNRNIRSSLQQEIPPLKHYAAEANSIEEIAKLKPQIAPPIRVAITPPFGNGQGHYQWSPEEIKRIEAWGDPLKATGLVSEIVIIPESLASSCTVASPDCVRNMRIAAAKLHADALLLVSRGFVTDAYLNPLSFLDITLIGLWLAPAHHRDSYALYQAYLADVANNYIYGTAHGEGEHKTIRPYAYSDDYTGQAEASIDALNALGHKLTDMAKQAMQVRQ